MFRFEGTAGFVSDQHGGSSRRFGSGSRRERDRFRRRSQEIQPDPIDTKGTISPEEVDKIPELQRGECTGTLIDGF